MRFKIKKGNIISLLFLVVVIALICFIYFSPHFEREKPNIEVPNMTYYNLKWDIPIKLSDPSGIRSYKVIFIKDDEEKILLDKKVSKQKEVIFNLPLPKINLSDCQNLKYKIIANDGSKNRFFMGNTATKDFELIIDNKLPKVRIVAMSNTISKGGSAMVVFYASDEAISDISISNGEQSFVAFPFYKENYYIGIIPWFIKNPKFSGSIIVRDKAGNVRRSNVNFTRYSRNFRTSNLTLRSSFIDGKIAELIQNENEVKLDSFKTPIDMFKYVNETMRHKDENKISNKILNLENDMNKDFATFNPLDKATIVGLWGDYRRFNYNKEFAGDSYHLGVDLAKIKNSPIVASNDGVVVMSEELGVYGNTIIIEHGYGIATLYSHLSESYKNEGDIVKKDEIIGKSGSSGLAFGDHLHFGVLVQGKPTISNEWMDSKWLKANINDVIANAIKAIEEDNEN
ncbi:MAG: M23 family metallopeptidase [Helicobacteraceae bacterium]|nr:M23 family metallopeptidase [Helicobacteraceae bacterium]